MENKIRSMREKLNSDEYWTLRKCFAIKEANLKAETLIASAAQRALARLRSMLENARAYLALSQEDVLDIARAKRRKTEVTELAMAEAHAARNEEGTNDEQ